MEYGGDIECPPVQEKVGYIDRLKALKRCCATQKGLRPTKFSLLCSIRPFCGMLH